MARQKLLVLGGSGLVGSSLLELWAETYELTAPAHLELDVLDQHALQKLMGSTDATTVLNLVAWADVDGAEVQRGDLEGRVYALNVTYPLRLARLCAELDKHLIHVSTDYVFDGSRADRPYAEDDVAHPVCWYAQTKFDGEQAVRASEANACIARIEMPFAARAHRKRDLARTIADRLQTGQPIAGVADQRITPVLLDDAAVAFQRLVDARYTGTIHVAASDWTTPLAIARAIATRLRLPQQLIQPVAFESFAKGRPALRPKHSWLDVARFTHEFGAGILRPVEAELDSWAAQFAPAVAGS